MAARKKAKRKRSGAGGDGGSLWAPKLGVFALRVFTGLILVSAVHYKLTAPGLPLGEALDHFIEHDYTPLVQRAVENPPNVLGFEWQWFSDALGAVALGGAAPKVLGTFVLALEGLVGIALMLGACTRLAAALGAGLMTVFGLAKGTYFLTVSQSNWYLVMICVMLALTGAGRMWGLDARLRHRLPGWIS